MTARYAIYYAPDSASALWQRACIWLGRDAASGAEPAQPAVHGMAADDFARLTHDPRHYGFHATLKAPFALAPDCSEDDLIAAARTFAAARKAFTADIAPRALGAFLAFRLTGDSAAMQALHEDAVSAFDDFRALPSEAELAKRRASGLTEEQDARLVEWGYPYVFEHFRFHMTLTGRILDEALRQNILNAATEYFAADIGPHHFDAIALFHQPDRQSPFTVLERFPFAAQ
jgi:putative phosphonate metabolism protein